MREETITAVQWLLQTGALQQMVREDLAPIVAEALKDEEITRLQQDLNDARTGWEGAVEEVREQDEKIVRLTAELEQARNTIKFMHDYEESTQQVAALVEACYKAVKYIDGIYDGHVGRIQAKHEAITALTEIISALPDRAKKIQAIIEAVRNHNVWHRAHCEAWGNGADDTKDCPLCESFRDLES